MPSPESIPATGGRYWPLAANERRELWLGSAFWGALLVDVLLTGYSYVQAVALYAEPSRTAVSVPELARGLSPLDGIVVPTLGGLYLVVTLLYPFVVIHTISAEKQNGSWKLLAQLPYSLPTFMAAKLLTALLAWVILLLPCLVGLVFWQAAGGHIGVWETANVVLGYFLYACVVTGIALAAASLTESTASAGILTLAFTLGFWVLDFAAANDHELAKLVAEASLTAILRSFERAIISAGAVIGAVTAGLAGVVVAGIWWAPGRTALRRIAMSLASVLLALGVIIAASCVHLYADASENRRNSFSPRDEVALRSITEHLKITVHLASTDPRRHDLERSVLGKLRRTMPKVTVEYPTRRIDEETSAGRDDQYGLIIYEYAGGKADSRSTSEEEILPLVFRLAGVKPPPRDSQADYPGYPLVTSTRAAEITFYFAGPVIVLACWALAHRGLLHLP